MHKLNFPSYRFRFKNSENKVLIFDIIRKKFVVLQPEEWVRQNCIHFLIEDKNYPKSLINVEKELKINDLKKRYDVIVFKPNGDIQLVVECKAPTIAINQKVFDQIARYNLVLNSDYLMVTNGLNHYYCEIDFNNERYQFLRDIPSYTK